MPVNGVGTAKQVPELAVMTPPGPLPRPDPPQILAVTSSSLQLQVSVSTIQTTDQLETTV